MGKKDMKIIVLCIIGLIIGGLYSASYVPKDEHEPEAPVAQYEPAQKTIFDERYYQSSTTNTITLREATSGTTAICIAPTNTSTANTSTIGYQGIINQ